jgi:CO/xanthine dehydrogenase Mo-binding subunit
MLHAKLFRSTVAHGKIKSIDTSAAKKVPGVLHVVTVEDVIEGSEEPLLRPGLSRSADPRTREGPLRRRAGRRRYRYRPHIAEQAVQLITADNEEMPAVFNEVEALTTDVYVHEQLKPAGTVRRL